MNSLKCKKSIKNQLVKKLWRHRGMKDRRELMLKALVPSSILFVVSVFTGSYKLLGLGSIQFTIIVFLNIAYMCLYRNIRFVDIMDNANGKSNNFYKKGKVITGFVYEMSIPAIILGISILFIMIVMLFFM